METRRVGEAVTDDMVMSGERTRLVRLCTRFTGDREVAEDLAQETWVEAWRHAPTLCRPEVRPAWLAGIARHVCLQWARRRGRDLAQGGHASLTGEWSSWDSTNSVVDDIDLERELERAELAELLDRALALLPPLTRRALVEKYIHEAPTSCKNNITLLGGLVLAQIGRRVPPWRLVALGLLGSSCLMVVLINVPLLPLDLALGALAGVVLVGEAVGEQTLLQTSVVDAYRGRVMAAYGTTISLVLLGGMGLGSAIGTSRTVVPLLNVAEGLYFCAGLIALGLLRA